MNKNIENLIYSKNYFIIIKTVLKLIKKGKIKINDKLINDTIKELEYIDQNCLLIKK